MSLNLSRMAPLFRFMGATPAGAAICRRPSVSSSGRSDRSDTESCAPLQARIAAGHPAPTIRGHNAGPAAAFRTGHSPTAPATGCGLVCVEPRRGWRGPGDSSLPPAFPLPEHAGRSGIGIPGCRSPQGPDRRTDGLGEMVHLGVQHIGLGQFLRGAREVPHLA